MSREERRVQILEKALNVFVKKGYLGATTVDIANAANISEVTLFRYFDSKQEVFMESIEPILVTSLKESIIAAKDLCPLDKLRFILKDRIQFISQHYRVIKLILMESQINPEVASFNYIEKIVDLLKNAIRESGFELKNEELSLRLLMGSILSFLYLPEMDESKIDDYIDSLIWTVINGKKFEGKRD